MFIFNEYYKVSLSKSHSLNLLSWSQPLHWEVGEMTQQLSALAALAENLGSWHPHGSSQTSVIPIPWDLIPSSDFHEH